MGILPPGFRFHPTDVELIMYYLKRKVMGKKFLFEAMAELNVYKYEPWDLAVKSLLKRDLEWYFFSPRERKYGSGARTNRATETGYWKATGKDRGIIYNNRTVGMIKTLIFYKGHAPKGERTDWVMHEYRLEDKNLADTEIIQDSFVICKIFQKSGLGPKNGAQYGAPFSEEEWNEVESAEEDGPFLTEHLKPSNHNALVAVNLAGTTASCSMTMSKVVQCPTPLAINDPCSPSEGVVSWLPICTNGAMHPVENYSTEKTNMFKSSQGAQDPITSAAFSEGLNNTQDICAIHSPVNGQVLSGHSPYSDLDNLAPLNLIIPGTTSSCPISEPGLPRLSATSNIDTNMPYDLPEDELTALLSMFTEDSRMIPFENNEDYHTVIDHSVKAQTGVDKNLIYNGLGDLNNLGELRNSDFDFSNTHNANYTLHTMLPDDDMIFLELKDLDSPLKHSVEARESLRGPSDSSYSPYTCYQNLDGSPGGSTLPKHVQNVSRLNLTSFPPEGSFWMEDLVEVSSKGPDIQNSEINGSDTLTGKKNPFQISCRQPVGSSVASQMQRRGKRHRKFILQFLLESIFSQLSVAELCAHIIAEKLNDSWSHFGGSTIYFKAEVALKVGECTEDALSHDMGESNWMCFGWGNLPDNNLGETNCVIRFELISDQWINISLLAKIIVRRPKYVIDVIIGSLFPTCVVQFFLGVRFTVYGYICLVKALNKTEWVEIKTTRSDL